MKTCPYCAEEIQDAAVVCKHCGRDLKAGATVVVEKKKTGCAAWGCLSIVVLVVIGWFGSQFGGGSNPAPTRALLPESALYDAWEQVFLSTADMGVPENVAREIRNGDTDRRRSDLSVSCAVLFTTMPSLQEVRRLGWIDVATLPSDPGNADIVTAANYATVNASGVCFDDAGIRENAFGVSGDFTREPLTP